MPSPGAGPPGRTVATIVSIYIFLCKVCVSNLAFLMSFPLRDAEGSGAARRVCRRSLPGRRSGALAGTKRVKKIVSVSVLREPFGFS